MLREDRLPEEVGIEPYILLKPKESQLRTQHLLPGPPTLPTAPSLSEGL